MPPADRARAAPLPFTVDGQERLRNFLAEGPPTGGYLTLAAVNEDRTERQLGRFEIRSAGTRAEWIAAVVVEHLGPTPSARLRIRRWGPGGAALGSLTFVVRQRGDAKPKTIASDAGEVGRLRAEVKALVAGLGEAKQRIAKLEQDYVDVRELLADWRPVVEAARSVILTIGAPTPSD